MTEQTHSCSYFCDRPECVKAQRDELREELTALRNKIEALEPDAVLDNSGPGPLFVSISAKHEYGCKLPHGTKFYILEGIKT